MTEEAGTENATTRKPAGPWAAVPPWARRWKPNRWALLPVLLLAVGLWFWFFLRIEPGSDEIAVLICKTGSDPPSGQILADGPRQKGIQMDVLPEGIYFRNPYMELGNPPGCRYSGGKTGGSCAPLGGGSSSRGRHREFQE